MNESTKWLYEKLSSHGYNVGASAEIFDSLMVNNPESRKWAYNTAQKHGYNVGEYGMFERLVGAMTDGVETTESGSVVVSPAEAKENADSINQFLENRDTLYTGLQDYDTGIVSGTEQRRRDDAAAEAEVQAEAMRQRLQEDGTIDRMKESRKEARREKLRAFGSMLGSTPQVTSFGVSTNVFDSTDEQLADVGQALDAGTEYRQNKLLQEKLDVALDMARAGENQDGLRGVENFGLGLWDSATRLSTWDFGASDIVNNLTLQQIVEKWENDPSSLTATEQKVLEGIGMATAVQELYSDQVGVGYNVGQSLPESAGFMASMALNPASGLGKSLARNAVRTYGRNSIAKNLARIGGDIAETAIMTATTGAGRVAADALERINGSSTYETGNNGVIMYGGQKDQETVGNAVIKAIGANFIENYSEALGEYFDPLLGMSRKVAAGGLRKMNLNKWADALSDVQPSQMTASIRSLREKTKFGGIFGEIMEEEIGMALNTLFVGDNQWSDFVDLETQLTTVLSCAIMSGTLNGVEQVSNVAARRKMEKNAKNAEQSAANAFGEQFAELRESIDQASPEGMVDVLRDVYMNQGYSLEQKRKLAEYAAARLQMQYYNAADAKARREVNKTQQGVLDAYEAGRHAQLPTYYNIEQEYRNSEEAINASENAENIWAAIETLNRAPLEEHDMIINDFTEDEQQLIRQYRYNAARLLGAVNSRAEQAEDLIDEYRGQIVPFTKPDGTVTTAILGDNVVFVMEQNENGDAVVYTNDGRKIFAKTRDLEHVEIHNAEDLIERFRQSTNEAMDIETENAFEHHPKTQAPQVRLQLQSPEGEVVITAVNDNMVEIVPAVYKDGQVQPKEGAEPRTITVDDAYAWQDSYYQGLDDAAATASQPTVDNMSAETAENEGTPSEQIEQSVSEEVADGQNATQPTETESVAPVFPAAPQTARERVPKDEKGNPIYEQTDADTAWDAIVEETEGDTEMAQRVAADMLEDKKASLAKLQNGKPKKGATVAEKIANEKVHQAAIAQAQNDVAQWEAIVGTEARRREAAMSEADRYAAEMGQKSINEGLAALGEPQSLEEYVLGQLAGGAYKLRWSDKENGTKGFGSHTGLSTEEMMARLSMIDNKNGLTPEEIAHSIVENMDASFGEVDVMDVTNMVIDAVATNASRRAMLNGMVESRAELMRQQARVEQEAKDAWYMEQYHATEEELAAYSEYLSEITEEIIANDANYEERFNTFAELIADEYDNQGTDADIRSSADQGERLASDREGSSSVGEGEETDRQGAVLGDAPRFAEAEDGRAGSSVSAQSDDRQSRIDRAVAYYRENVDDSPEAIAAAERDQQRYEADMAEDAAETVETLENGDVRRTNRNSLGEIATVVIERDGNVISVDTYEDGALFEHTDYDANGNATKVTRYKDGEVVSEQEYKDGKRKVTANVEDIRRTPLSELEYVKRETDRLFNEREDQSLSREEWELADEGVDAENAVIDSYPSYIQSLSDSGELQRMFDMASVGEEIQIRRAVEAAGFELDDVVDTSVKRANAKAARDKKRAEKAKKLIESVTTNKEKQNGAKETIPEGGQRGRRSEKQGENQGDTRQSKSVIGRQIEEFELRTGWSRELSDTERLILEDVRKLTDSEIAALRNEAIESIERGEDVEDIEIVLSLLEKYGRSGERLYILSQSGIIPNQPVSLDKVEQLFMEYNEDEGLAILFDRLRPIIEKINPKITFEVIRDVDGNVKDSTVGDFYLKDNHLRFNLHSLNSSYQTDQEKASTIVHEMIHAITQYAIDANERGDKTLPKNVLEAAKSLVNIYNQIKDNEIFNTSEVDEEGNIIRDYGVKDVHEMISELANPEFREKLKQIDVKGKNAWERIIDAIARFINQFKDIYDTTAYGKAVRALDALMDNFNLDAYERSRALGSEAKESRVDNLRFREKGEPKELIAVHNISEDNLRKVLEAGSLIMPSIAITKADMGHTGFGEISLLFDKSTINPSDRRNKVYGGDAWTPRFPRIGVKLNDKVVSRINKKAYELIEDRRLREIFSLSSEVYPDNIEKVISDYGVEGYYNKEWMKLAYLLDSGKRVKIPTKAKDYGIASEDIVRLAKEKGLSVKEIYEDYDFYKNNPDFVAQVKEARDEARLSSIPEEQRDEMRERMQSRPLSEAAFDSYIRGALEMENDLANGGLKEIVDRQALRDLIEKKVKTDNAEYNKWVDNLFEGIVEKRGIRNNRDWYTPSGNLRPWGQLYDPATPANILKYMLAENEQGGSGGFFDSNIMGASAETYESIEEIREKGKKRLKHLPYEEYDEWSNSIADRMAKICDDFLSPSQRNSMGGAIDAKIEITNAVAKDKTSKGIYKHMHREYPNFTMEHAKQVEEIVKEIQEFATGYFEAKPQRLVFVNEVMAAVVPSNASKEIVDALKNNGIEVVTYKKGDEEARKRVVKRVSSSMGIRFRDGAPFFSNAERAVENIKQNKATPEQWLAMIKKDGGLKAGEDKWMGLSDWLNEQKEKGVKTLTKDEVLQFIRENQIEIEEVNYEEGVEDARYDAEEAIRENLQELFDMKVDEVRDENPEQIYMSDIYEEAFERVCAEVGYNKDDAPFVYTNATITLRWYPDVTTEELLDLSRRLGFNYSDSLNIPNAEQINSTRLDYTTEGLDNKKEIAFVVPTIDSWNRNDETHFGDAGEGRAVAWVRFGETTDKDGKRVLVIDEVQSKRHDEGRAKGYQSKEKGDLLAERDRLYHKMYSDGLTEEEFNRRNEINARLEELGEGRIPDAPFDKNYHELVMKRMLRYAAENGYDKVAWTKGVQQARRYDLGDAVGRVDVSRVIDSEYSNDDNQLYDVVVLDKGGEEYAEYSRVMSKDEIKKLFGDGMGDIIIDSANREEKGEFVGVPMHGYKIGDESRGALYDEMIPRFMNKYTKKWGTKVGEVTLPNVEAAGRTMWSVDVTPEMRESVMQGQPMFREGMGAVSDREVSYENDPIAKFQGKPRYYGKKAAAFGERERKRMENAAKEAAEMLGIEAEIVTDASTLQGRKAKAKGWYDIVNKKVVVVVPNHVSMGDAVRTVLHEGVAHHGLRELFGDGFDAMLDNVYNNVAPELKARIDAIAERTGVSTSVATEEYMASLAETTNFEEAQRRGWWQQIKGYFVDMLRKLAMPGLKLKEDITDNELRYLLWRSYKNLVEPNSYLKPLGYAEDVVKQKELKVGEYAEKAPATPMAADTSEAEEWAAVTMQRIEELEAQAAQLENEIAEMEADRDADDASRYEMWEQQLDPLRKQMEDVYAELEGLYSLEAEAEEMSMVSEDAIRYRLVDDPAEIERLESEPTIKAYRAMQVINGELYPPMSAVVDGKLREPIALGQWEQSEERPDLADDNGRFKLDKGNKKSLKAAYNPYFHSSSTPLNDQFSEAQDRDNLVTVEVEVPVSEADGTSGYKAEKAKDAVGTHQWKAGIIQGQLTGTREVFLTRWDKPIRIVPESEVADVIVEMFDGKDIVMPSNVVTPQLRKELEERGITFVETDNQGKLVEGEHKGEHYSKVYGKKAESGLRYREDSEKAEAFANIYRKSLDGDFMLPSYAEDAIENALSQIGDDIRAEYGSDTQTFFQSIGQMQYNRLMNAISNEGYGYNIPYAESWREDYADEAKDMMDEMIVYLAKERLQDAENVEKYIPNNVLSAVKPKGNVYKMLSSDVVNVLQNVTGKSKDEIYEDYAHEGDGMLTDEDFDALENNERTEIIAEVERESAALGVPVRIARSVDELPDEDTRKRAVDGKLKGYFDPRTGEVVLYEPNTENANDAKRTILHEIVGHKGLRSLIGEQQYDKAMVQLMYLLPAEVRDAVLRRAERHGWNAAIAMDEYLAEQAERDVQPTWWGKVNAKIRALLRNMGFNVKLTDADVTYLLWRSRKKLQGDTAYDMATDAILKQAARKSAEAEAWNEQAFKDMEMRDFERNTLPSIRHRMGADTNDYEKAVRTLGFKQAEAWQDSMRSLLVFQQALAKASGKDISDFENAYMYENRMSSANLMEMEQYRHMVYNPLLKEIHELEQMGASRESIINYLFAKSGLERNEVFARRDAKKHAEGDATKEQQLYDKYRQKDYAGLTALTKGDAQIAALVDDHSKKKTEYERLEQNKKRGVAVSDADLKAAKKEMNDARKAMITAIETEAQRMVDEFEAQHNTDNLWDKIRNCTHTTLNISHDAGVMSDEVYNELWNQFQYYIPLRGFAETTAEDVYLYLGGNDSPYNAPIKTAYGRTSLADDPIATIGNMAESAIVEANRNRLKQRFLYMVERHNTDLASISDVWLEYDDVNDEWHTVFAQIPDDATPSEAKRLQQEFEDRMKQLSEQNPGKYANARQQPNIPYRVVKKGDRQEHHVIVKRNGKDVVITINGNPRVAQAINGLTNPEQNQGMITRITSWINRNLSANFTMRNPAFMVSNFVRDGFYTNSMVWVKENPAYAWQYNQNWMKCTAQIASLVKRYKRYEKGDTSALDMNNDMDRMFYEFMINGGETGYTVIKSVEDYKGLISGEMKKMEAGAMGTARRVADTIGNVVDTFGRWAEDTSRFAAYMTSRQLGRTITKSIWDAKEISVNFNKKGSGNRMMGKFEQGNRLNYVLSNMSQLGRNLYVFWNAGVQGFNNFKKAAKDSPAKFTAMAGTYFTLGVIVAAAFSGDDDEDDYYNLPEYVRRNNICFKIGKGKYATLPLPIEIRAIYGLGELAYSYLSGREGLTHGEAVTKTIQQMTQIMPIDMMADGGGAMALVPSAAKPVVEVIHNVDWTGRPIYKEKTPWNQNDPTWTLAFKSTSPELVGMSRLVNEWTNKNTADGLERPYNRGWADNRYLNNPAVWEHIMEGYLGGMATMFNQSKKTLMMPFNEDLREVRNVPIASRFIKDAGKEGRSYAARNEYYDAKNIMDSWKNEMSKAKKEVLDESLTDEQRLKAAKLRSSLEQQYMEAAERWKVLDRQRKALEEAYKNDQSEDNRQALDDVMMQMATLVEAYRD